MISVLVGSTNNIITSSTYIVKHFTLSQRNLLQVRVMWTILEGEPVSSAFFLKLLLSPPTITDDVGVDKVRSDKICLLAVPVTGYIVGVLGEFIILIVPGVLFHDN